MKRALCVLVGLLASACFRTTIHSGLPPDGPAPGFDRRWHSGFVFGLVEIDGPYDLQQLCPVGWSELASDMEPLQVAAFVLTLGIYAPQRVTIVCARGSQTGAPVLGHPPPPPPVYR
jgi:hypothetical protein